MPRTLSATTDPAPITATEASILWTECLHGAGNLRSAMDAIAQASQASSIVLIRACLQTNKLRILSSFDRDAARGAQPMPQPLGLDLITVPPQSARLGSVWSLQDQESNAHHRLDTRQHRWLEQRRITDAVCLVLGQDDAAVDLLELHLPNRARNIDLAHLGTLAAALAFAWNRRPAGRLARLMSNAPSVERRLHSDKNSATAPLSSAILGN